MRIGSAESFRAIDTAVADGRFNVAFDQALIDAHNDGRIPSTIRFLQFKPCVLIGRHQALSQEVHLDYCARHDIGVGRRITGGGAIYLDEGQLGWELISKRTSFGGSSLVELTRNICEAAAVGLAALGVDARFRPRNDIEVNGRKISGTGGFFDGSTIFFQGTLLIDLDRQVMARALNIAGAKAARHGVTSAAERVVTLAELKHGRVPPLSRIKDALLQGFSQRLNIEVVEGETTDYEMALAERYWREEIGTDEFVAEIDAPGTTTGEHSARVTGAGGTIAVYLRLSPSPRARIQDLLLAGDFFATPPRAVLDLEASLKNTLVAEIAANVDRFFAAADGVTLSIAPEDLIAAIERAASAGPER